MADTNFDMAIGAHIFEDDFDPVVESCKSFEGPLFTLLGSFYFRTFFSPFTASARAISQLWTSIMNLTVGSWHSLALNHPLPGARGLARANATFAFWGMLKFFSVYQLLLIISHSATNMSNAVVIQTIVHLLGTLTVMQ